MSDRAIERIKICAWTLGLGVWFAWVLWPVFG